MEKDKTVGDSFLIHGVPTISAVLLFQERLYGCITFCLSAHPLKDGCFWFLEIGNKEAKSTAYKVLSEHVFSILGGGIFGLILRQKGKASRLPALSARLDAGFQ
jgi:hypothetical protein